MISLESHANFLTVVGDSVPTFLQIWSIYFQNFSAFYFSPLLKKNLKFPWLVEREFYQVTVKNKWWNLSIGFGIKLRIKE